jgi:hypothetical protein
LIPGGFFLLVFGLFLFDYLHRVEFVRLEVVEGDRDTQLDD